MRSKRWTLELVELNANICHVLHGRFYFRIDFLSFFGPSLSVV
jgi:hypothetical protein